MCGRIRQAGDGEQYLETIHWNPRDTFILPDQPRYDVPPGSRPLVLHRLGDDQGTIENYQPKVAKKLYPTARLDTILKNGYFWKNQFAHGRVIIPDDGWFEWTGEKPNKQPW